MYGHLAIGNVYESSEQLVQLGRHVPRGASPPRYLCRVALVLVGMRPSKREGSSCDGDPHISQTDGSRGNC